MSAAFTPGPWKADSRLHVRAAGDQVIARCYATLGKYELEEPNARLIAAAPELLDALQPFVAHNSDAETITIIVRTADVKRARAAIAKATGEQQ